MNRTRVVVLVVTGIAVALLLTGCGGGGGPVAPTTYSVSGQVVDSNGAGVAEVSIVYTGGASGTVTAKEDGTWTITGLTGTVTITPQKDEWTFSPANTVVDGARQDIEFVGTQAKYTITITYQGQGSVSVDPEWPKYPYGQSVTLNASPASGWTFSHWSGDLTGSDNPATIVIDGDKSIAAVFVQNQYRLEVSVDGQGTVLITPEKEFYYWGDEVELVARPEDGWYLQSWSDSTTTETTRIITIAGDALITARFRPVEEGLFTRFYGSVVIGSRVNQMVFSIVNKLPYTVGLSKVQVNNQYGYTCTQTSDPELLNGNRLEPNDSVALSISPAIPPLMSEAEQWVVYWYILVDGKEYVVTSSYSDYY